MVVECRFVCSNNMLGITDAFTDLGGIRWNLTLSYFVCWCLVVICLSKGIQSSGKVVHGVAISASACFSQRQCVLLSLAHIVNINFISIGDINRVVD